MASNHIEERWQGTTAGQGPGRGNRDVAGVVAQQRHCRIGDRGDQQSATGTGGDRLAIGIDDLDMHVFDMGVVTPGRTLHRDQPGLVEAVVLIDRDAETGSTRVRIALVMIVEMAASPSTPDRAGSRWQGQALPAVPGSSSGRPADAAPATAVGRDGCWTS